LPLESLLFATAIEIGVIGGQIDGAHRCHDRGGGGAVAANALIVCAGGDGAVDGDLCRRRSD